MLGDLMNRSMRHIIAMLLTGSPLLSNADNADWMQEATSLLKNNQADRAVSILEPQMESSAGDLQYDFLLGQAALANNQANLAVFALERVVLTAPSQDGARFTLARAYAKLGEYKQARKELLYIVKTSKSSRYKQLSESLLDTLHRPNKTRYQFVVKAGLGNDSNANSATEIDSFLGVTLSENSKATASSTAMGQMYASFSHPLSNRFNLTGSADLFKQDYQSASFVNTSAATLNTGLSYQANRKMRENMNLFVRHTEVDKQSNSTQLAAQLTHWQAINTANTLNASLRAGRTEFAEPFSIKSVNQLNAGLQHQFKTQTKDKDIVITTLSLIGGKDIPLKSATTDDQVTYGRTYTGAQAGILIGNGHGKINMLASINYINSQYDSQFFNKERNENNIGASFKLDVKLNAKWKLSPGFSYARSQSSVELYDYERTRLDFVVSHQLI